MIEVISMWYNEEFLAPFFLDHYSWADKIIILLDADTDDGTEQLIKMAPNARYEYFTFPNMMDDDLKAAELNARYRRTESDWVLFVDADEFIYHPEMPVPEFLQTVPNDLVTVIFYQVYRHITDDNLTYSKPVLMQRRHGDPNVWEGVNGKYRKPCVAKQGLPFRWGPGCHSLGGPDAVEYMEKAITVPLFGAHWLNADPCFCVERRVKGRRDRQSRNNLRKGLTSHQHGITKESVLAECKAHENDPIVICSTYQS